MQFDLWSFALQLINFLILVWLLQRFLYQPVRRIIAQRREAVDAKVAEAEKARKAAEEEKARLETEKAAFEAERDKRLGALHAELAAERTSALADAEAKARALIDEGRKQIENERAGALKSLEKEVAGLAADMAAKILTERSADAHAVIAKFEDYARGLSDEERRRLSLSAGGGAISIVTAAPINAAAQQGWKDALGKLLGAPADAAFSTDASLIAGAEVHFPHAIIKLSASDALTKLKEGALAK